MNGILGRMLRAAAQREPGAIAPRHRRTVSMLSRCRTGELGHLLHACSACGGSQAVPKACGNRHCPQCQGRLARAWFARQQKALLETPYFHVVCTLPHALLPLCATAPRELYALLFEAASGMLLRLFRERLGGEPGITMVLHTWGQRLGLHPHVHAIVTGGALLRDGSWRQVRSRRYLFPVGPMATIFRGKFLEGLTRLKQEGRVPAPAGGWPRLWQELGRVKSWVVYCRPPFAGPASVLAYLGNYTHRVAISENRIEHFDEQNGAVTYRYRDYADGGATKRETLPLAVFVRRFLQHVLPRSFTKIRHYGILANHARSRRVPQARAAIARRSRNRRKPALPAAQSEPESAGPACPHCQQGALICVAYVRTDGREIRFRTTRALPAQQAPP